MFFGRIYNKGKPFKPSWHSYATYAAMIVLMLLAVEYDVLNVLPDNKMGQVLLIVPAFYFVVSAVFLLNDLGFAAWRRLRRGKGKQRRRKPAAARVRRPKLEQEQHGEDDGEPAIEPAPPKPRATRRPVAQPDGQAARRHN